MEDRWGGREGGTARCVGSLGTLSIADAHANGRDQQGLHDRQAGREGGREGGRKRVLNGGEWRCGCWKETRSRQGIRLQVREGGREGGREGTGAGKEECLPSGH